MALSRWQSSIVDQQGNIQPFAELVVLNEETQGQAALFHDREGNSPISGNVVADEDGYAYFYASAGRYRIQSVALDIDWRDVEVGVTGDAELNDLTVGGDANFSSMLLVGGSPIVSSGETNAGSWVQYADGTMIQWLADTCVYAANTFLEIEITYPKAFMSGERPAISLTPRYENKATAGMFVDDRGPMVTITDGNTGCTVRQYRTQGSDALFSEGNEVRFFLTVTGRWKQ